jgi:hypothetical protein
MASAFFYLHGFASSPRSTKAQELRARFEKLHRNRFDTERLALHIPDLNQNDFTHLTLTRQLQQVKALLSTNASVTLIGSSFGGLTAAWLGESCPQVERLVLLAPAFRYLHHWLPTIEPTQLQNWQAGQPLLVYHYGEQRLLPLDYQIVSDLQQYDEAHLQKPIPTLIVHGTRDEVIPVQSSRDYAIDRPWVQLIELNSDHALTNQSAQIWQEIYKFCFC